MATLLKIRNAVIKTAMKKLIVLRKKFGISNIGLAAKVKKVGQL